MLSASTELYRGKALSRKELAQCYGVSPSSFNRLLRSLGDQLPIGSRSTIFPKEVNVLIHVLGDWRKELS